MQVAAPMIPIGTLLIRQKNPSLHSQLAHSGGIRQMRQKSTQTPGILILDECFLPVIYFFAEMR